MSQSLLPSLWLIALSIAAGVSGQTAIKLGVPPDGSNSNLLSNGLLSVLTTVITSPLILLGLFLYGIGALSWIVVLSRLDLSYAYPFLALNFVLVTVVSRMVLDEPIPLLRWVGIGCICLGILLVARSPLPS